MADFDETEGSGEDFLLTEGDVINKIDGIYIESGWGSRSSAHSNLYHGINHRGVGNQASANRDVFGLTLFSRPRCNLSDGNCNALRTLLPLLTKEPRSIQRAIRAYLDPLGVAEGRHGSPIIDQQCAFIPLLTNTLLSINGFPDPQIDTYTSNPGIHKEAFSHVDGIYRILSTFDVTADFANIQGDPISLLFNIWGQYMAGVYQGEITPYPDAIIENEIDYQTRIYRLVLDHSRSKVQKICAVGAAFPTANTIGASFNVAADVMFNDANHQISIPFRCIGVDYFDPILVSEFNRTVFMFNPSMKMVEDPAVQAQGWDASFTYTGTESNPNVNQTPLVRLTIQQVKEFNYRGYPYIDPYTETLQWWVPVEDYNRYYQEKQRYG